MKLSRDQIKSKTHFQRTLSLYLLYRLKSYYWPWIAVFSHCSSFSVDKSNKIPFEGHWFSGEKKQKEKKIHTIGTFLSRKKSCEMFLSSVSMVFIRFFRSFFYQIFKAEKCYFYLYVLYKYMKCDEKYDAIAVNGNLDMTISFTLCG